jgi:hypothetical protein
MSLSCALRAVTCARSCLRQLASNIVALACRHLTSLQPVGAPHLCWKLPAGSALWLPVPALLPAAQRLNADAGQLLPGTPACQASPSWQLPPGSAGQLAWAGLGSQPGPGYPPARRFQAAAFRPNTQAHKQHLIRSQQSESHAATCSLHDRQYWSMRKAIIPTGITYSDAERARTQERYLVWQVPATTVSLRRMKALPYRTCLPFVTPPSRTARSCWLVGNLVCSPCQVHHSLDWKGYAPPAGVLP